MSNIIAGDPAPTNPTVYEQLVAIVTRDPQSAGGDRVWACDLVDAHAAEVLRGAADRMAELLKDTPEYGSWVADQLRRMAGGAR